MKPERFLVTGGGGFIGSHVVRTLREHYPDVPVRVMHLPDEKLTNLAGLDVEYCAGDITRREDVERAVEGCDIVFHLAAVFALWLPDMSVMDRVNVDGSRLLLEVCAERQVRRVVFTSTFAVFGGQGHGVACNESSPFRLEHSYYSKTKYLAHRAAEQAAREGLDVVIVCPAAPVGPGDIGPTPTGKLFLDTVHQPVNVLLRTGSNYVDVRDCALGHVLAMEKGRTGESYILGGQNFTMKQVVRKVEKVLGKRRPSITVAPSRLRPLARASVFLADRITGRPPLLTPADLETLELGLWADCGKARRELGLPGRPLEESIRDALRWFAQNGYIRGRRLRRRLGRV